MVRIAGVAQSVEQLICNQQVAGSSPIASSKKMSESMEGFPSGQREQTVNLPAKPTEVRTLPPPPYLCCLLRWKVAVRDIGDSRYCCFIIISGSSSVARASAFQAEGRGFESRFPLQFIWQEALPVLHGSTADSAKVKMVVVLVVTSERGRFL